VKPYYQDELAGITIWHGDCRDILPTLAAESADLLITDPPYGMKWRSNHRNTRFAFIDGDEDQEAAVIGVGLALRVLRNKRHVYVFGRYDFKDLPLTGDLEIIWDKVNIGTGDLTQPWASQHEYIQFRTYVESQVGRARGEGLLAARLRKGTVLRYMRPNATGVKNHPTEKPVALLRELIESSSRIGEVVLDPFVGVGSTLVAAQKEDRRAIGIEVNEAYCEIAARRLQQSVMHFEVTT
jgi:DNA modification methylase